MVGSGSTLSMIASVKNNLALRRGRNTLFERQTNGSLKADANQNKPICAPAIRKKNQEKLQIELLKERRKAYLAYGLGVIVAILLGLWLF